MTKYSSALIEIESSCACKLLLNYDKFHIAEAAMYHNALRQVKRDCKFLGRNFDEFQELDYLVPRQVLIGFHVVSSAFKERI